MTSLHNTAPIMLIVMLSLHQCHGLNTYEDAKELKDYLLNISRYDPTVRPLLNQSEVLRVSPYYEFVSIIEVNDVQQSIVVNGYLALAWTDQMLTWNASQFGGIDMITPNVNEVFRPRMYILNTLQKREMQEEDELLEVYSDGLVNYHQGGDYQASCQLDLTYYPFDYQTCTIVLVSANFRPEKIVYAKEDEWDNMFLNFYIENREWEMTKTSVETPLKPYNGRQLSTIELSFYLRRRPMFYILSVLLPIVLISMLNLLVFFIPVDTGDKVGYAVTVLLALAVYMGSISENLPRSSNPIPLIIIYILILLIISVLSVIDAIIIVNLYQYGEKKEASEKGSQNASEVERSPLRLSISCWRTNQSNSVHSNNFENERFVSNKEDVDKEKKRKQGDGNQNNINKHKRAAILLNFISLIVFGLVWLGVNFCFLFAMNSHKI